MLCECLIWLSLASYHENRAANYNEINPGIVLERNHYVGGYYYNSIHRHSVFIARDFTITGGEMGRLSFVLGAISGYRNPVLGTIRWTTRNFSLYFVPSAGGISAVIGVTYRIQ